METILSMVYSLFFFFTLVIICHWVRLDNRQIVKQQSDNYKELLDCMEKSAKKQYYLEENVNFLRYRVRTMEEELKNKLNNQKV